MPTGIVDPWAGYRRGLAMQQKTIADMAKNRLAQQRINQDEVQLNQSQQRLQFESQRIGLQAEQLNLKKMDFLIDSGATNEDVSAFYNTQIRKPNEPEIKFERKGSSKYQLTQGDKVLKIDQNTGETEVEEIPELTKGLRKEEEREFSAKEREAKMMSKVRVKEKRAKEDVTTLKEQEGLYNSIVDDARQQANVVVPKAGAGFSFGDEGIEFTGGDRDIAAWQKAHDEYLMERVNASVERGVLSKRYKIEAPEEAEFKEITEEEAKKLMEEAGGSADKARELAQKRGFKF